MAFMRLTEIITNALTCYFCKGNLESFVRTPRYKIYKEGNNN